MALGDDVKDVLSRVTRIETKLDEIGKVTGLCEAHRAELWQAVWRNRVAIVVAAFGAGGLGSASGAAAVTKILGLW